MPTLWFVVPVHGRLQLAAICLRQLRRTCDALTNHDIEAAAVIVADHENLGQLQRILPGFSGFGTIARDNRFLSRRFNDGIQLALDPTYNPRPADYVVPCGSDDWIDYRTLIDLPGRNEVHGFQRMSFVREDGREMTARFLNYTGGCGIRVYHRSVLEPLGYRPADEDRERGCDTSILTNVWRRAQSENRPLKVWHVTTDPRQIVDWKTAGTQLNTYRDLERHPKEAVSDPFVDLEEFFPAEALAEMAAHYGRDREPVAA